MSWNIKTPGDYINGPLTVAGNTTITGDLTVDTSTLKVDSTNNRVGIVQATPLYPLHLVGEFGLEEASAGNGSKLRMIGQSTKYNFRLGKQIAVDNAFEITPSTAVGGTTFTNPVYTVTYDGIHTFLDGAGGTRMTLNSTGLGVGVTPTVAKVQTNGAFATNGAIGSIGANPLPNALITDFSSTCRLIATGPDTVTAGVFKFINASSNANVYLESMTLDASGNLLVGTTSQLYGAAFARLNVDSGTSGTATFKTSGGSAQATLYAFNAATTGDNAFITFGTEATFTSRGSITYNRAGGLVAYNTTSDYRAKDIIGPVSNSGSLIDSLKVYIGKMKGATIERPMLIAHETQEVAPYAVTGLKDEVDADGKDKYQQMDVSSFVPLLIAEIQSLRARVQTLEAR